MTKTVEETEERDSRISESIDYIAKSLNLLEAATIKLKGACEEHDWNDEVVYQVEDAARNLGFSLATLNRWYSDIEENR